MIQAVVGSGGKTTYIKKQANFFRKQGLKVFVTTSTHMFVEEDTLETDDAAEIIRELEEKHYVMAGCENAETIVQEKDEVSIRERQMSFSKCKIQALSRETYEKVCAYADVVLVEADGSKQLPIKFPASHEPVIYDNVDEIVVICGLHALGKKIKDVAHRVDLVLHCLNSYDMAKEERIVFNEDFTVITEDTIVTAEHIQKLLRKGYLEPLKEKFSDKKIIIQASHDDSLYQRTLARLIESDMDVSMIKKEWFASQPKLVVCGGGHVAKELVMMASCLDFYIKVIDDREEFANKERFPMADEVICDSFDNLSKYLEPNGYYVVVTRGHKADYECVKMILNSASYEYLGMIGSKLKVKTCFERLTEEGYCEEQINSIFAPIGLKIKANTPAEIALSILAEIIQEKNSRYSSYVSRELLEVQEPGVLCIIIEKTGSSPRGEGSMMFVSETGNVIDTIGGGTVEFAAIQDAKKITEVTVKEYHLNNQDSERLGMICGGSNKVLFVPLGRVR